MKAIVAAVAIATLAISPAAFAQTRTTPNSSQTSGSQANSSPSQSQNSDVAQKIQKDLSDAGFTDVKVVAESYVVQAKSKGGDPVLMTIGPRGMSVFEAMNANGSSSNTIGSGAGSTPASGSSSATHK